MRCLVSSVSCRCSSDLGELQSTPMRPSGCGQCRCVRGAAGSRSAAVATSPVRCVRVERRRKITLCPLSEVSSSDFDSVKGGTYRLSLLHHTYVQKASNGVVVAASVCIQWGVGSIPTGDISPILFDVFAPCLLGWPERRVALGLASVGPAPAEGSPGGVDPLFLFFAF